MAFTVEDGTGSDSAANAYADEAAILAYLTDRNRNTENNWDTVSVAERQSAIIKATDYIDRQYGPRMKGRKTYIGEDSDPVQPLQFPRSGVVIDCVEIADDSIPNTIVAVTAELAVRALPGALLPDPTRGANGQILPPGPVTRTKEKVGPLEVETQFAEPLAVGQSDPTKAIYPQVELLIAPFLVGAGLSGHYARA